MCESLNILSESQFINFIETMHTYGLYSSKKNNIALIDLNPNYKVIYSHNFHSLTKQVLKEDKKFKNKSNYQTQIYIVNPIVIYLLRVARRLFCLRI